MNSADFVAKKIDELKQSGSPLQLVAWEVAKLCVGWAYVFGGRGEYCSPANRRVKNYIDHPSIKTKCKNFDGNGLCIGCRWYPDDERTRFFDCRGFTYWVLLKVFGWKLMGAGATSQWKDESNWKAKGEIATMPADTLVCLFVKNGNKMEHTGFGYNKETIECSSGVQYFPTRNKKWTHWGVPACIDAEVAPSPLPILRRGDKGEAVRKAQEKLIAAGYDCGKYGIDGDFGTATEKAVKAFQADHGLTADGVIGSSTWAALDAPAITYTVTIPHLSKSQADALCSQYPGATAERG